MWKSAARNRKMPGVLTHPGRSFVAVQANEKLDWNCLFHSSCTQARQGRLKRNGAAGQSSPDMQSTTSTGTDNSDFSGKKGLGRPFSRRFFAGFQLVSGGFRAGFRLVSDRFGTHHNLRLETQ